MTELDASQLALGAVALVIAGAAKAGFGGSGAFAGTPILALALPPGQALGVMLPLLMAIDLLTLGPYWRKWSWRDARALMLAGAVGCGAGWAAFRMIDAAMAKLAVGSVALAFAGFRIAVALGWTPHGDSAFRASRAGFWGFVCGLTSFVAHAGGPPAAMSLIPRGLDKTVYQATTVVVFWWINVVKIGPYAALGLIDGANLALSAIFAPFAALGVVLGLVGHRRIPQRWFDAVILAGLVATGLKLVIDAAAEF